MRLLELVYKMRNKEVPYYARYSIWLLLWKPIRKYVNVVIAPNVPFNVLRIMLYRFVGFKIGSNVFIGMKCYLDDMEPSHTTIKNNVTISYGCYFSLHGKGQTHLTILVEEGAYLGMRCNIVASKGELSIGKKSIIGAGSLVLHSVNDHSVAVGVPAKVLSTTNK